MKKTHGMSLTPEYRIWNSMVMRCHNPNTDRYDDYGGRGIIVCERWRKFDNFLADMGRRPDGMTLERKDNDGNYEPDNVCWATRSEQARNTRRNRIISINGESKPLADWCLISGLDHKLISYRVNKGWKESDILLPAHSKATR